MKTLVKRTTPRFNGIPSIFDDLFFSDDLKSQSLNRNLPSVNIRDKENEFILEFALPGYQKEDLEIKVEKELLTVSSETKNESEVSNEHFTRKEFAFSSFSRSFNLPEIVDIDNIDAESKDGILTITLPKRKELLEAKIKSINIK